MDGLPQNEILLALASTTLLIIDNFVDNEKTIKQGKCSNNDVLEKP